MSSHCQEFTVNCIWSLDFADGVHFLLRHHKKCGVGECPPKFFYALRGRNQQSVIISSVGELAHRSGASTRTISNIGYITESNLKLFQLVKHASSVKGATVLQVNYSHASPVLLITRSDTSHSFPSPTLYRHGNRIATAATDLNDMIDALGCYDRELSEIAYGDSDSDSDSSVSFNPFEPHRHHITDSFIWHVKTLLPQHSSFS